MAEATARATRFLGEIRALHDASLAEMVSGEIDELLAVAKEALEERDRALIALGEEWGRRANGGR